MSSFTSPLIVEPLEDGKRWILKRPFTYHIGSQYSNRYIKVPQGFLTDFASIPKFLWFLPYWAKYSKAPVLHDWLYHSGEVLDRKYPISIFRVDRKQADKIFLEAMLVDWRNYKSRYFVAYLEFFAVRIFARFAWQS